MEVKKKLSRSKSQDQNLLGNLQDKYMHDLAIQLLKINKVLDWVAG